MQLEEINSLRDRMRMRNGLSVCRFVTNFVMVLVGKKYFETFACFLHTENILYFVQL